MSGFDFEVKIDGLDTVIAGLETFQVAAPRALKGEIRSGLIQAREEARTYPPYHSITGYVRTHTYFRSFRVVQIPEGWALQSDAVDPRGRAYTVYVGGDEAGFGQSWNTGHWPIIKEKIDEVIDEIVSKADQEIQKIATQFFGPRYI